MNICYTCTNSNLFVLLSSIKYCLHLSGTGRLFHSLPLLLNKRGVKGCNMAHANYFLQCLLKIHSPAGKTRITKEYFFKIIQFTKLCRLLLRIDLPILLGLPVGNHRRASVFRCSQTVLREALRSGRIGWVKTTTSSSGSVPKSTGTSKNRGLKELSKWYWWSISGKDYWQSLDKCLLQQAKLAKMKDMKTQWDTYQFVSLNQDWKLLRWWYADDTEEMHHWQIRFLRRKYCSCGPEIWVTSNSNPLESGTAHDCRENLYLRSHLFDVTCPLSSVEHLHMSSLDDPIVW